MIKTTIQYEIKNLYTLKFGVLRTRKNSNIAQT